MSPEPDQEAPKRASSGASESMRQVGSADGVAESALALSGRADNWSSTLRSFLHPRVVTMLFFGFSAGVPILLIFSSLSLWLGEAGVEKSAVTFFSWAALGYSFKFVWAPLVDRLPLPGLTGWLGRRRGWLLFSQLLVMASIGAMALINPAAGSAPLTLMALAAVALGFSSATQDIVIDAYRIESAEADLQALMSSSYIAGYRIGMIVAGAGTLYLASLFGTQTDQYVYVAWRNAYLIMMAVMLVGVATTLIIDEPMGSRGELSGESTEDHLRFLATFLVSVVVFILAFRLASGTVAVARSGMSDWGGHAVLGGLLVQSLRLVVALLAAWGVATVLMRTGFVRQAMVSSAYLDPVRDFFHRYGAGLAVLLLALVGFYRVSDIVLGVIANVFYQDMGYTKVDIANVSKVFGLLMTISGGFLGGLLSVRYGVLRILMAGAVLSAITNLLFVLLASVEANLPLLYVVIGADNLSAGLALAAFIAFLSALTNVAFTAVQYAIFSSIMTLFPKVLGGYSGSMVEAIGYPTFFLFTTLLTVPVVVLILLAGRRLTLATPGVMSR